jgi:hypothetical protein
LPSSGGVTEAALLVVVTGKWQAASKKAMIEFTTV